MISFNLSSDRQFVSADIRTYASCEPYIIHGNTIKKTIISKNHQRVYIDHWRGTWYVLKNIIIKHLSPLLMILNNLKLSYLIRKIYIRKNVFKR